MGGLEVSGSHGLREIVELSEKERKHSLRCHAGTRLYIKPTPSVCSVVDRHVPKLVSVEEDSVITVS